MALGSDISTKFKAWECIREQITAGGSHPEWIHRHLIDQMGVLFADLFHKIGGSRLPFCIGPAVATQLFACWHAISVLASGDPASKEYSEFVSRNVNRARALA